MEGKFWKEIEDILAYSEDEGSMRRIEEAVRREDWKEAFYLLLHNYRDSLSRLAEDYRRRRMEDER